MLSIQRILFPTDFSDGAARAFPQAAALAEWHDAELHIVHVGGETTDDQESLPVGMETLESWLTQPGSDQTPSLEAITIVQKEIEAASPAEQLVEYVASREIDLVVMGTHGRRGVRRMLLGSVTEEVVRKAPCPVLTVTAETDVPPRRAVRRILVPVDFSDASDVAVQHAKEIALTYGAELDLLHVVEEVAYPSAYGLEPPLFPTDEIVGRVEKTLGDMAREDIGYEHVQISVQVGYPPMTILDYVRENEVDLLVIATHGRTGIDRLLMGSVAERILRESPVPVFLVKPQQKSLVTPVQSKAAAAN